MLDLYFAQNRFYNADTRQFTTQDPIKDGMNWYVYCEANPLVNVDWLGLANYKVGGIVLAPQFEHDRGFIYDPNEEATASDYVDYSAWYAKGMAALVVPNLHEPAKQYLNCMDGRCTDTKISYITVYNEDSTIKKYIDSEIETMKKFVQNAYFSDGVCNSFEIIGDLQGIPNGEKEKWQKTIGAHHVYGHGKVEIDNKTLIATMTITFYMEDMYNFNPGQQDIATGTPDAANGRFAVLGWAKEFKTAGSMTKVITWNMKDPSDIQVEKSGSDRN